jgi:hypothetical protein
MTTIAWRDGVLAADSTGDSGGVRVNITKIFPAGKGRWAAMAGDYALGIRYIRAFAKGETIDLSADEAKEFHVVIMNPDGTLLECEDGKTALPIEDRFYAIGSGRKCALAAMACGKSAIQAVRIAAQFDINTGGAVIHRRASKWKK